jgi:hypothetical protein
MFDDIVAASLLRDEASADIEEATRVSGICLAGDSDLGIEGYAIMIEDEESGSLLCLARRGKNCWTVMTGATSLVLMVSTTSLGGRNARGPLGYPEQPGKTTMPASVRLFIEEPVPTRLEDGDERIVALARSSRIGSRLGWMSTAGLGTVDVRSIHNGRKSALASCCTSESSSVEETVTYTT